MSRLAVLHQMPISFVGLGRGEFVPRCYLVINCGRLSVGQLVAWLVDPPVAQFVGQSSSQSVGRPLVGWGVRQQQHHHHVIFF